MTDWASVYEAARRLDEATDRYAATNERLVEILTRPLVVRADGVEVDIPEQRDWLELGQQVDADRELVLGLAGALRELVDGLEADRQAAKDAETSMAAREAKAERRAKIGTVCGIGGVVLAVAGTIIAVIAL